MARIGEVGHDLPQAETSAIPADLGEAEAPAGACGYDDLGEGSRGAPVSLGAALAATCAAVTAVLLRLVWGALGRMPPVPC